MQTNVDKKKAAEAKRYPKATKAKEDARKLTEFRRDRSATGPGAGKPGVDSKKNLKIRGSNTKNDMRTVNRATRADDRANTKATAAKTAGKKAVGRAVGAVAGRVGIVGAAVSAYKAMSARGKEVMDKRKADVAKNPEPKNAEIQRRQAIRSKK